jgi:hypothetical protein
MPEILRQLSGLCCGLQKTGESPLKPLHRALGVFSRMVCTAAFVTGLGAHAAPAAPLPPEVFYRNTDLAEAHLSPSGRWLAITGAMGAERAGLVIFDVKNGGQPRRIVQFADGDVTNVQWVNDDRLVFSALDFSEGSGRGRGAWGLFAVNADGSKRIQLVRRLGSRTVRDPASGGLLEWNHVLLSTPLRREGSTSDEVLVGRFTINERRTLTPLWLDTLTGRTRGTDFKLPTDTVRLLTDPYGEARVAFTRHEDREAAFWRAPGSEDWQPLYDSALGHAPFNPHTVDSAGNLYVMQPRGAEGYAVLARYDFGRHAPDEQALVVTPGFDFSGSLRVENDNKLHNIHIITNIKSTT